MAYINQWLSTIYYAKIVSMVLIKHTQWYNYITKSVVFMLFIFSRINLRKIISTTIWNRDYARLGINVYNKTTDNIVIRGTGVLFWRQRVTVVSYFSILRNSLELLLFYKCLHYMNIVLLYWNILWNRSKTRLRDRVV